MSVLSYPELRTRSLTGQLKAARARLANVPAYVAAKFPPADRAKQRWLQTRYIQRDICYIQRELEQLADWS